MDGWIDRHTHTHTHTHIYIYIYIYIVRCYSNDSIVTVDESRTMCIPVVIQLHYIILGLKSVVWKSVQQSGCGRVKLLVENLIINRVLCLVSHVMLTLWLHTCYPPPETDSY